MQTHVVPDFSDTTTFDEKNKNEKKRLSFTSFDWRHTKNKSYALKKEVGWCDFELIENENRLLSETFNIKDEVRNREYS
jgi:hypothetical protein